MGIRLANRGLVCGREEENLDHLLLQLGSLVSTGFFHVQLESRWQAGKVLLLGKRKAKKIWLAAPICIFWSNWRQRNRSVFEEGAPSAPPKKKMKYSSVYISWSGAEVLYDYQGSDVIVFLSLLLVV